MSEQNEELEVTPTDELFSSIVHLNKERLQLDQEKRFFEAGLIKDQLKRIGEQYVNTSLYSLRERQQLEKQGLEQEYQKEIEELTHIWAQRIVQNEEEIAKVLQAAHEGQKDQIVSIENSLRQNMPQQVRFPPKVLNLEYQVAQLAKDQQ